MEVLSVSGPSTAVEFDREAPPGRPQQELTAPLVANSSFLSTEIGLQGLNSSGFSSQIASVIFVCLSTVKILVL